MTASLTTLGRRLAKHAVCDHGVTDPTNKQDQQANTDAPLIHLTPQPSRQLAAPDYRADHSREDAGSQEKPGHAGQFRPQAALRLYRHPMAHESNPFIAHVPAWLVLWKGPA